RTRAIELLLRHFLASAGILDPIFGPGLGLDDLIAPEYVMRPARQGPTADRGPERDGLAVICNPPIRRRQRRDDLLATPAAAAMGDDAVVHRDVEDSGFE